jgi:hypothetical protein
MADLVPCPSCGNKVSNLAASCPACGHPFRSAQVNVGYNAWDYAGLGVCVVGVAMFLAGAVLRYNYSITDNTTGNLVVASVVAVVLGLLLMAVGRVLAGAGKK